MADARGEEGGGEEERRKYATHWTKGEVLNLSNLFLARKVFHLSAC